MRRNLHNWLRTRKVQKPLPAPHLYARTALLAASTTARNEESCIRARAVQSQSENATAYAADAFTVQSTLLKS